MQAETSWMRRLLHVDGQQCGTRQMNVYHVPNISKERDDNAGVGGTGDGDDSGKGTEDELMQSLG